MQARLTEIENHLLTKGRNLVLALEVVETRSSAGRDASSAKHDVELLEDDLVRLRAERDALRWRLSHAAP
jgi:hypothetical protein